MKLNKRYIISLIIAAACLAAALGLEGISRAMTNGLLHQNAAERFMADGDVPYKQISIFFSTDNKLPVSSIEQIQSSVNSVLKENSIQAENEDARTWCDAWSTDSGIVSADGVKASDIRCSATLVGGDFFEFHPMQLMSGCYIRKDDLMKDRVVIDTITAWNTFGSSEVADMEITINGKVYRVAGVVEPEKTGNTQTVYGSQGRIYMPYPDSTASSDDPAASIGADAVVSCYETVLPNPVRSFAENCITKAITSLEMSQLLINTDRDSFKNRFNRFLHLREMVICENNITYPWWENSARLTDYTTAQMFGLEMFLLIFPVICLFVSVYKLYAFISSLIARKIEANKRKYRTIEKDPYAL